MLYKLLLMLFFRICCSVSVTLAYGYRTNTLFAPHVRHSYFHCCCRVDNNFSIHDFIYWPCTLSSMILKLHLNPLLPEFFFLRFFRDIIPKIGSFRLLTHSREAHRTFFLWSLLILGLKFWQFVHFCAH